MFLKNSSIHLSHHHPLWNPPINFLSLFSSLSKWDSRKVEIILIPLYLSVDNQTAQRCLCRKGSWIFKKSELDATCLWSYIKAAFTPFLRLYSHHILATLIPSHRFSCPSSLRLIFSRSNRKVKDTLPLFRQFFSSAFSLTHVSLASMKLPPDVLRYLPLVPSRSLLPSTVETNVCVCNLPASTGLSCRG